MLSHRSHKCPIRRQLQANTRHSTSHARCARAAATSGQDQPMAVSHPAASFQEQVAWEEALSLHTPPNSTPAAPITSHPAVGATQAECSAWEDALSGPAGLRNDAQRLYAVVECGSHSTRLLLSTGSRDILRWTKDTHLGDLTSSQQQPPAVVQQQEHQHVPAAAAATLAAVREYRRALDQHKQHLAGVTVLATAALREAAEGPVIAAAIADVLGCPAVRVLSGAQEAQLAFKGATAGLTGSCCCLVIDLGGRSTEFALGVAGTTPQQTASIPLGCLAVRRACGSSTVSAAVDEGQQLLHAAQMIVDAHKQQLWHISRGAAADRQVVVVATGGTATTLAALHQQLQQYTHDAVHMSVLRTHDIHRLMQEYLHAADVTSQPAWLTAARAAALAPGCAGLLVLLDWLGVDQVQVSDSDLLDGAVAAMVDSTFPSLSIGMGDQ